MADASLRRYCKATRMQKVTSLIAADMHAFGDHVIAHLEEILMSKLTTGHIGVPIPRHSGGDVASTEKPRRKRRKGGP